MPLSDLVIRSAKPADKPMKLADEKGLFLLVQPSGGKLWRLKYRFGGKEKKLSLGTYPEVSLKDARVRRDEARSQLAAGVDPSAAKKAATLARLTSAQNSFAAIGAEYLNLAPREGREAVTVAKSQWLLSLMAPDLGARPVADITPAELLAALRKIEAKGHHETARRMRSLAGRIFRYAVATSRASADPSALLRGALVAPKVRHRSAILDLRKVGQLLRAIEGFDGHPLTRIALQLLPHVFVRPGELRRAEWSEFDIEQAVWTIPAAKMKMRAAHRVPLSQQALALLDAARPLSTGQKYVFSALYPGSRPMSENTINAALRRLGYSGDEMTSHGFRAIASTLLNSSGRWSVDAIERALAHAPTNIIRVTYNRGDYWDERVRMAHWWSDYLTALRDADPVQLPPKPEKWTV